jgi:hypothetical protein
MASFAATEAKVVFHTALALFRLQFTVGTEKI